MSTSPTPPSPAPSPIPVPAVPPPPPASTPGTCFNTKCCTAHDQPPLPLPTTTTHHRAWRLRSGDSALLCDRCFHTYQQGRFCDTFHTDAPGWRKCESCVKRVHCGCVVSASAYLLLDAGGVECITCARKTPAGGMVSERPNIFAVKNKNQMANQLPGQWRQASHMWKTSIAQSDLQQRLSYELDRPNTGRKLIPGRRYTISSQEKKTDELPSGVIPTNASLTMQDACADGKTNMDALSSFNAFRAESTSDIKQSGQTVGESDSFPAQRISVASTSSAGVKFGPLSNSCINSQSSGIKDGPSPSLVGVAAPFSSSKDINIPGTISGLHSQLDTSSTCKQMSANTRNSVDSCGDLQSQMHNGRSRAETLARIQLLPRYWPRVTQQELQQISGDSNTLITPLFEKILSASDAGRIGRLVLPKKCAEAYFPPISQPEGQPLKVQDVTGKEWVFQFRFWPNNNSRMYVLEGVTPCIQSMRLQAGDTVIFSRIDPEGKLVMGYRKPSGIPAEQDQTFTDGIGSEKALECNTRPPEFISNHPRPIKSSTEPTNLINVVDNGILTKSDKIGFIQKVESGANSSSTPIRKKGGSLGSRNKRLHIDNEESVLLKLTWEEAQERLRSPPNHFPRVVVIDGHEVEEYEEAPVLGKPTILTTNEAGDKYQWAQCEECSKWRKIPMDVLLPFSWHCSDNTWDPERSSCYSAQELSREQLVSLFPGAVKRSRTKVDSDCAGLSDGLDTLANLAILSEGESLPSSSPPTTRHPRHRPGCTCIVCIQPPSGKGPKHKQTCTCNVCVTVRRRFRTLMLRREKQQKSEKVVATSGMQLERVHDAHTSSQPQQSGNDNIFKGTVIDDEIVNNGEYEKKQLQSPLKSQIDLNIQPERDEELSSPVSNAGNLIALLSDAKS